MEKPIGREKQIIDERIKKIEELRAQGVNPYAYKFEEKRDNSSIFVCSRGLHVPFLFLKF